MGIGPDTQHARHHIGPVTISLNFSREDLYYRLNDLIPNTSFRRNSFLWFKSQYHKTTTEMSRSSSVVGFVYHDYQALQSYISMQIDAKGYTAEWQRMQCAPETVEQLPSRKLQTNGSEPVSLKVTGTVTVLSNPHNGKVTIDAANNAVTFTPSLDTARNTSFIYRVGEKKVRVDVSVVREPSIHRVTEWTGFVGGLDPSKTYVMDATYKTNREYGHGSDNLVDPETGYYSDTSRAIVQCFARDDEKNYVRVYELVPNGARYSLAFRRVWRHCTGEPSELIPEEEYPP